MIEVMGGFDQADRISWGEFFVVLSVCVVAAGAGAVYLGQDANWDQRNYHLYTVHAWLTGRMFLDVAPSQIQTWLNPLPHIPGYFLIRYTRPVVAGLVMGAMTGVNGLLLWIFVRRQHHRSNRRMALACATLATVCGLTGSVFISYLGTTFAESFCSPLVLAALICLTGATGDRGQRRRFLAAGCCLGAVCGLKLTHLMFALAMSATLVTLWPFFRFRLASLMMFAFGGLGAFAVVGGYWAAKLWIAFGNPMFPFFNGLFRSPLFEPVDFVDARFLPASFLYAAVTYPFSWFLAICPTSELPFREPRFALVAVFLPLAMVVTLLRSSDRRATDVAAGMVSLHDFWLCALFFAFSYAIWLKQFAIQRYVLPLELLTGVMLMLSLERVLRGGRETSVVLGLLTCFAILWTRPPDWHRVPYSRSWYDLAPVQAGPPTLYVMTSWQATAYLIPYMPPQDRFVRLGGNMPLEPMTPLGKRAMALIDGYDGPIRTLSATEIDAAEQARLQRFGLDLLPDSCKSFRSTMDIFWSCELVKRPSTRVAR